MKRFVLLITAALLGISSTMAQSLNKSEAKNLGAFLQQTSQDGKSNAAALGIDAVLLTPTSSDPLNRRAVRVSKGSVFLDPWTWATPTLQELRDLGFRTAAMALTERSVPISHPALRAEPRLAIVLGTEGDGLAPEAITAADYVVRIPMAHGVDSLNVAAASAVAFWELTK